MPPSGLGIDQRVTLVVLGHMAIGGQLVARFLDHLLDLRDQQLKPAAVQGPAGLVLMLRVAGGEDLADALRGTTVHLAQVSEGISPRFPPSVYLVITGSYSRDFGRATPLPRKPTTMTFPG